MKSLTRKEILEELKKIGVDLPAELSFCLKEYEKYKDSGKSEPDVPPHEAGANKP